jgi:transcriptional regulator with XRE-family HTH domain
MTDWRRAGPYSKDGPTFWHTDARTPKRSYYRPKFRVRNGIIARIANGERAHRQAKDQKMVQDKRCDQNLDRAKRYQFAQLELAVTELLCELMEKNNVSRAELARRVGVKPPYVTRILRGQTNLTLKTVSDFFFALGRSVRVVDRPMDAKACGIRVADRLADLRKDVSIGVDQADRGQVKLLSACLASLNTKP